MMIEDVEKAMALTEKMRVALPMGAIVSKELQKMLQEQSDQVFPHECSIADIGYMGEEGGISCHLDFGSNDSEDVYVVSITHLMFDSRNPLSREIRAYCKHRIKRLKKLHGGFVP